MASSNGIRSLSRTAAAHARWNPGTRAEKLAEIAVLDAKARRHRQQAEELESTIAAELSALVGGDA